MIMDSIMAFSGGVDSVYVLYKYMKDNPNKTILIHHVRLKNHQGRMEYELRAVKDVLRWMDKHGYRLRYKYIESGMDYGNIKNIHYDITSVACFTGIILKNSIYKNIKYVICTPNKEESQGKELEEVKNTNKRVTRDNVIKLLSGREDLEIIYPIYNIPKDDIINDMPKDLFELCWYCRKPTKDGKPCGVCFTCCRVRGDKWKGGL